MFQGAKPIVASTRGELARALSSATLRGGASGGPERRGLVMTMGALHSGHLALIERARIDCDTVVASIFVNPLQFGPGEDFERYPRPFEADLELLAQAGVDIVYAPTVEEMYPGGALVRVGSGDLGTRLEGSLRPGHFDGVLTVVLKVLLQTRPDVAYFGQKDAQQLALIRRMTHDLDVPVQIEAVPIVRDADGLALSSRNVYLSDDERGRALALSRAILAALDVAPYGASGVRAAVAAALTGLAPDHPDYVVLADPATLDEVPDDYVGPALLLLAARVGTTRLLDNTPLEIGAEESPVAPALEASR